MQFLEETPYIRQTRMIRNSEWYSITWGLSVTIAKYLPIHTSNFLDLITDKFIVVSSSYQKWVSSLALFSNEAGVEQIRFNLRA